jgi:hypothetical protein
VTDPTAGPARPARPAAPAATTSPTAAPPPTVPGAAPPAAPSTVPPAVAGWWDLDPCQRSVLVSWLAFTATFATVRGVTYSIRAGRGPFRNLSVGGEHLHHYMWGIGLLTGVGAVAVRGEERARRHPVVATCYGSGLALVVDEFALLLDLRDVYWARQGRISVDLGIGAIGAVGCYFAGRPFVRSWMSRRRARHDPGPAGEMITPAGPSATVAP